MIDYRRPFCHEYAVHEKHYMHGSESLSCPGYTAEEMAVHQMIKAVEELTSRYYPPLELPPGAHLRVSPAAYAALLRNLVLPFSTPLLGPPGKVHNLPVVNCIDIPQGSWQVIMASGEVPH